MIKMKKAIVIGGSNGMGLAISCNLIHKGYFVEICDRCRPDTELLSLNSYNYTYCDLTDFDESIFYNLASDSEVEILIITAGIGRVADLEAHHIAEIDKILTINSVSTIKILRIFYERIKSAKDFYTGVMGSISGWMTSPAASVYAASKASVVRFMESVNIELEGAGVTNRILDVSPGSFKGSRFYGGKNDISQIENLADQIVNHVLTKDTIFIPQYDEVFSRALERYHLDPHEYGLYSYNFKKESGRMDNSQHVKIGYMSGTFDLFHIGHLNVIKQAKQNCDYLIVGVHKDGSHKGKEVFIPFEERMAIVGACKYVDKVVPSMPEDSDAVFKYGANMLFVGSDYKGTERFRRYEESFEGKGIKIMYFPYTTGTSSTQIREHIINTSKTSRD